MMDQTRGSWSTSCSNLATVAFGWMNTGAFNCAVLKFPARGMSGRSFDGSSTSPAVWWTKEVDNSPGGLALTPTGIGARCKRSPARPGKAGRPVDIWMDQPVKGPDAMRAANGKLLLAENGSGKTSVLTVNGDKASVTVIEEGLKTPTAVKPSGDTI